MPLYRRIDMETVPCVSPDCLTNLSTCLELTLQREDGVRHHLGQYYEVLPQLPSGPPGHRRLNRRRLRHPCIWHTDLRHLVYNRPALGATSDCSLTATVPSAREPGRIDHAWWRFPTTGLVSTPGPPSAPLAFRTRPGYQSRQTCHQPGCAR